jgi:hypothetical protein
MHSNDKSSSEDLMSKEDQRREITVTDDNTPSGKASWILPILSYCFSSILMTLTNKLLLSGFKHDMIFLLLTAQVIFVCVGACRVSMRRTSCESC